MDRELAYIILLPLGSLLWMLGGWKWKSWRRFVLPVAIAGVCLMFGVDSIRAGIVVVLCGISFSLPYGENSTWKMRIITALSFGIVGMPLGLNLLQALPPIVFLSGWVLSNKYKLQWKICEALTGLFVVLPIAQILYAMKGAGK